MTRPARDLLRDVLNLPERDRLDIVIEVLTQLDGPREQDWETAWLTELDRREQSEGTEPTAEEEWSQARARILAGPA